LVRIEIVQSNTAQIDKAIAEAKSTKPEWGRLPWLTVFRGE